MPQKTMTLQLLDKKYCNKCPIKEDCFNLWKTRCDKKGKRKKLVNELLSR